MLNARAVLLNLFTRDPELFVTVTLKFCGKRQNRDLYHADKSSVVSEVYYNVFEREFDGDFSASDWSDQFLICMTSSGNEWTDGWIFVLIEAERPQSEAGNGSEPDRVLYRSTGEEAREAWLMNLLR